MVFDKLGLSLYDFLRRNHYRPFSLPLVREFGRQLLEAVACAPPANPLCLILGN